MTKNSFLQILLIYSIFLFTLYFVTILSILNWNFLPDDAYRYFHVTDNIINGFGVRWNVSDGEPSQSFTSFPWILTLAGLYKLTNLNLPDLSKLISLICFYISFTLCFLYILSSKENVLYKLLFFSFCFISSPIIFFHTVNGMETMMFMLFITLSSIFFLLSLDNKKYVPFAFLFFLCSVVMRYESVIFLSILTLLLLFKNKKSLIQIIKYLSLVLIIPGILYLLFKFFYFGNLLPNSFYVKTSLKLLSPSGYIYLIENYNNLFLVCSMAFLLIIPFSNNQNKYYYLGIFIAIHIQLLFILRILPTVGYGGRFMYPYLIPLYLLTINISINFIIEKFHKLNFLDKIPLVIAFFLLLYGSHSNDRKQSLKNLINYSSYRTMDPAIGKSFKNVQINTPRNVKILGGESGAVSYFTKFTFIDIWGLHDKHIAQNGLDLDYIFDHNPDVFFTFVPKATYLKPNMPNLDHNYMSVKTEMFIKHKDIRANTTYYSYKVMADKRFQQFELIRKIPIGDNKYWIFYLNKNSIYSKKLTDAIMDINWTKEQYIISKSMHPKKIIRALLKPYEFSQFKKLELMFP